MRPVSILKMTFEINELPTKPDQSSGLCLLPTPKAAHQSNDPQSTINALTPSNFPFDGVLSYGDGLWLKNIKAEEEQVGQTTPTPNVVSSVTIDISITRRRIACPARLPTRKVWSQFH